MGRRLKSLKEIIRVALMFLAKTRELNDEGVVGYVVDKFFPVWGGNISSVEMFAILPEDLNGRGVPLSNLDVRLSKDTPEAAGGIS
uniref:Uncharacterized protein n=1 Tax=Candidatus Kentrum sp. MB TaxID=2138164 RepID=A0A450XTW8_9GAMM|nr:MAG: hypothetical protein BECKMB1821G_GA0114241_11225 [Candidatus Kentron sp. MB]VFK35568.1 MAG: hypothetical protein BECKMB1821I_GA0114274_11285 [Candidatus Kentron sp. MB]VFK77363.1 MAG: hypothetical protein BECKMB1821H_GA0114242_11285 [Candidatus Kentron sp. MB]